MERVPRIFASVLTVCLALPLAARAHIADPAFLEINYLDGFTAGEGEPIGQRLAYIVNRASTIPSAEGKLLLPFGTALEQYERTPAGVLRVQLAMPADAEFGPITELHAGTIDHVLGFAIVEEPGFFGISVDVRIGDEPARPLADYLLPAPEAPPELEVTEGTATEALRRAFLQGAETSGATPAPQSLGGPIANADGQPQGALSGVVVFANAGHGWTGGSSGWGLQRPLLLGMNEDYGNLDQLNIFVQYLYNAGATVVPFRPVGYQKIEIVLDNDDPGVTYTGTWSNSTATGEYYENKVTLSGVPYRYATANVNETATARYTPNIPQADFYPVYCWTRDGSDRVPQKYKIHHSGGDAAVVIDHRRVGKGWIWLGNYYFEAGTGGWVEISNQSTTSGVVIADAIRFGNGMGNVPRTGSSQISGFPREEECARYWAHSELTNNAVGMPSSIYDCCSTDNDDNVGTAARWARAMNRMETPYERWRRVYMEFHTNAAGCAGGPPCSAKGTVFLVTSLPTQNQVSYATIVGNKVKNDMLALDDEHFEHAWGSRSNPASGTFGAISTSNNSDEFDATIAEFAFHDNQQDAENLRNLKVRDALARSTTNGIIQFLNTLPGSGVPLIFPPDAPRRVQAAHDGVGNIVLSWLAPQSGGANGGAATGYKIYRSTNGYGFGQAVDVGNVLSASISNIAAGTTVYLRVVAYNGGGESMPSETLAVRRAPTAKSSVLIVNGFDRVSRQLNPVQSLPGGSIERQIAREINSFDYAVQHANALAAANVTFDTASNEAVIDGAISLGGYAAVVWICGRESTADKSFSPAEQSLVTDYLNAGGRIFISGTDVGFDLQSQGGGAAFYQNTLRGDWLGDNANTFSAVGSGGILTGVPQFSFARADGAPYVAASADRIAPGTGAINILNYVGGTGGGAGIQYDSGIYRVVLFGFPFETIANVSVRNDVMQRIMDFLLAGSGNCIPSSITGFEGFSLGSQAMFRQPGFSPTTAMHIELVPNVSTVTSEVSAYDGVNSCKVQWQFKSGDPSRWLRLTTQDVVNVPNPTISLRRPVRMRVRFESPAGASLRAALGVRETGVDVPIGSNGGVTGSMEWVGATSVVSGAPQGQLITAQPGVWQTITFLPVPENVTAFPNLGDGVLSAEHGKGTIEHVAFTAVDHVGPFTLYIDGIDQECPPATDFDGDEDVDMVDFAHFQLCMTGENVPQNDPNCQDAKLDGDDDVDYFDYVIFQKCLSGADVAVDPSCDD